MSDNEICGSRHACVTGDCGHDASYSCVAALIDEVNRMDAELATLREADERAKELIGLHESVELIYVVDGYMARLTGEDGGAWSDGPIKDSPIGAVIALLAEQAARRALDAGKSEKPGNPAS